MRYYSIIIKHILLRQTNRLDVKIDRQRGKVVRAKVCVIGHFGFGKEMLNGQTIKTKIVTAELEKQLGTEQIVKVDTHGGMRALPRVMIQTFNAFCHCENIVIFPAHNGLRIFAPICTVFNSFFHRKLHYVVIGGWLPEFIQSRKKLAAELRTFDGIYVETSTMKKTLEIDGFRNIIIMPNFKDIRVLTKDELVYPIGEPYKLCTFSRVMKEKGIGDAVEAVKSINRKLGRTAFELDIYGQIDEGQVEWFDELKASFPEYIRYKGLVPFDGSVEVLKDYFALLFPTRFFTEGIPGTIIDAYAAGVPVISAKWESFADVVDDGVTGFGYQFCNTEELKSAILKYLILKKDKQKIIKENCCNKANFYIPKNGIKPLIQEINVRGEK